MIKTFLGCLVYILALPNLWGQSGKNPMDTYMLAPPLEIISSKSLIPGGTARLLPQAGLVKLHKDQEKGMPLLFVSPSQAETTPLAPINVETVEGARTGVLATLASFDLNFTHDIENSRLALILVREEEVENEEVVSVLKELVPGVEALFERTPETIAREVFEELLHLIHYYIIDARSQYRLLSEEIDKAYRESVKAGFYNPRMYQEAYPEGDDIHPDADFVRGEYLATIAKVCFGFFEGQSHDGDSQGQVEYPFTTRQEVQQNDTASYRIFCLLFKENILRFDDLLDIISLNMKRKP
jgi:hypothetical protein